MSGFRGSLGVPMIRDGQVIGAILVARTHPGFFADSQVQLKMKDGALYTLRPQSRLDINAYRYDAQAPEDNAVSLNLVEGALRTVSGAVGKSNPAAYSLQAGSASIGIRGTEFEVAYEAAPAGASLEDWCSRK